MPDENSAASEHAIMQEITQPLAELPHDPVAAVANADFPVVLRGYDREAVDDYVRRTTQLVAELFATSSPEGAVRRALERVGEQVSSILARAHETAAGITSQSRVEAEERLMQARAEAEELERDAHALADQLDRESEQKAREREQAAQLRVQELDADVDRIWAERDRIVSDVRRLGEQLSELAGVAATRFPAATTDEAALGPGPDASVAPAEGEVSPETETEAEKETEIPTLSEPDPSEGAESELATLAGSGVAGGDESDVAAGPESETAPGRAVSGAPEPDAGLLEAADTEVPSEAETEWRAIPANMRDDQFAPGEHPTPAKGLGAQPAVADPDNLVVEPVAAPQPGPGVGAESEPPTSVMQRSRMRVIDLHHLGNERVIGCWQVDDVLIDPGPASCLEVLLAELEEPPRALLLTHIHLDHAGASGSLVKRWPDLEVYVHEQGASHLADPARLLESAQRLYGRDLERLWGEFLPVPEANLRILSGGERLLDGRFEVAYTPGHASHHVSYLFERTAFVGDVGGVRISPDTLTIPPTPPPDIDIEAWHASIDQLLRWKPERLAVTHFGANDDIGGQLADLADRLDTWAALVHTEDLQTFVGIVEGEIERGASPAHRGAYKQAAPPELIYAGLDRYWRKREGDAADQEAVPQGQEESDESTDRPRGSAAEPSTHAGRSVHYRRWMPRSD